jgi:hypothetical protein
MVPDDPLPTFLTCTLLSYSPPPTQKYLQLSQILGGLLGSREPFARFCTGLVLCTASSMLSGPTGYASGSASVACAVDARAAAVALRARFPCTILLIDTGASCAIGSCVGPCAPMASDGSLCHSTRFASRYLAIRASSSFSISRTISSPLLGVELIFAGLPLVPFCYGLEVRAAPTVAMTMVLVSDELRLLRKGQSSSGMLFDVVHGSAPTCQLVYGVDHEGGHARSSVCGDP